MLTIKAFINKINSNVNLLFKTKNPEEISFYTLNIHCQVIH